MATSRRRSSNNGTDGPTDADLAEIQAALGSALHVAKLGALPGDAIAALVLEACSRGYTLSISAAVGRQAYWLRIPLGTKRLEVYTTGAIPLEEQLRAFQLAVEKLPARD